MLLAILLLQTSMAQVCNKLPQDTLCGQEYAGYPIAKPIQDFNNSLTDAVANLDNVAANFAKGCGASNNVNTVLNGVSSLRFQVSIQCSFYVKEAIDKNCPVPPPLLPKGPLLCLDQCRVGAFSLQSFIRNSTTCPKGQTDPQLAQNYKFENEYCQFVEANIQANNNVCIKGSTLEAANCGWQSKTLAIQQCKTVLGAGFDDVCCKSLLDKENSSGSNTLIIIGVVVIVIIIIIAIGTLLFFKRRNAKSNRKSVEMPSTSYKNSDYDYNSNRNQYQKDPAPQKSPYNNNQYNQPLSVQTTPNYQKQQSSAPVQRMNPAFNYNQQDQKSFSATPSSGHTLANYSDQNINSDPRLSVTKPITPQSPINTQPTKQIKKVLMPEGAKEMITIHPYVSSMEDELQFSVGASIYLLKTYDDGWALGMDAVTGQKGAFPQVCVQEVNDKRESKAEYRISKRLSSKRRTTDVIEEPIRPSSLLMKAKDELVLEVPKTITEDVEPQQRQSRTQLDSVYDLLEMEVEASITQVKSQSPVKPQSPLPSPTPEPVTINNTNPEGENIKVLVLHPYVSSLEDELSLTEGSHIILIHRFDDGWAFGLDPATQKQGAFPMVCVQAPEATTETPVETPAPTPAVNTTESVRISKRLSSLIVPDTEDVKSRNKVPFSMYLSELDGIDQSK